MDIQLIDIMKLTTYLAEKVGADKLLHFLLTSWLVAEAKVYGLIAMLLMFILILILGLIKEVKLDVNADYSEWYWSVYGGLVSICLYIASSLLGA